MDTDTDLAIKIRVLIGKWQEIHPEDEDEDVCRKTAILASRALGLEESEDGVVSRIVAATPSPEKITPRRVMHGNSTMKNGGPTLVKRLQIILEGKAGGLRLAEIASELAERKWLPRSQNLNNYLLYVLKANSDVFCRVDRGYYGLVEKEVEPSVLVEAEPEVVDDSVNAPDTTRAL